MIESILDEAKKITSSERLKEYGNPDTSFNTIAKLWGAYLGIYINASDVAMLMILLKIARQKNSDKRDNLVDIAGYTRCLSILNRHESL